MKDYQVLIKSYRQLFNLTGRIEFFMMYKNMEKSKEPLFIEENANEYTL